MNATKKLIVGVAKQLRHPGATKHTLRVCRNEKKKERSEILMERVRGGEEERSAIKRKG